MSKSNPFGGLTLCLEHTSSVNDPMGLGFDLEPIDSVGTMSEWRRRRHESNGVPMGRKTLITESRSSGIHLMNGIQKGENQHLATGA